MSLDKRENHVIEYFNILYEKPWTVFKKIPVTLNIMSQTYMYHMMAASNYKLGLRWTAQNLTMKFWSR